MLAARKSVAKVPGVFDNFYPHSLPLYLNITTYLVSDINVDIVYQSVHVQSIFNLENDTFTVS